MSSTSLRPKKRLKPIVERMVMSAERPCASETIFEWVGPVVVLPIPSISTTQPVSFVTLSQPRGFVHSFVSADIVVFLVTLDLLGGV